MREVDLENAIPLATFRWFANHSDRVRCLPLVIGVPSVSATSAIAIHSVSDATVLS